MLHNFILFSKASLVDEVEFSAGQFIPASEGFDHISGIKNETQRPYFVMIHIIATRGASPTNIKN